MGQPIIAPRYTTFTVDLSVAGSKKQAGESGLIRMVDARASGALALDALVSVRLGETDSFSLPLTYGNAITSERGGWTSATLEWEAQPGVVATFLVSRSGAALDQTARPAKQLVTSALATQCPYDRQTIGTTAASVAPVTATRQSIGVKADPLNTGTIYVASDGSVTASTGWPLAAGESHVFETTARIDAIASAAGQTLHVFEEKS